MTSPTDGGFAFPVADAGPPTSRGMTLRDWFAGQALNGLLAQHGRTGPASQQAYTSPEDVAASQQAYNAADAMLEAREKGKSEVTR